MDGVPYRQPLVGPEPQYVPWGVLLVRPIGHPPKPVPPQAADQRSRAYPTLLRVLRWGRYGHRGGPQTPEVGSLVCVSRGPSSSRPPLRCVVCGGGFPVSPGWGGGGGGRFSLFLAVLLVCVSHLPWLWFAASGGGWSPALPGCGSGSLVWLPATPGWGPLVLVGGGPSPLLAVVRQFAGRGPSLPAVGCGWAFPRLSWLRAPMRSPATSGWGPVVVGGWLPLASPGCGSWARFPASPGGGPLDAVVALSAGFGGGFPVLRVFVARRALVCALCVCAVVWVWVCLPSVLARVWRRVVVCFPGWGLLLVLVWVGVWLVCGRSLTTPGGGSCVRFPTWSGWVALPLVVGVPRHSWLRAPGAVPCHSWLGSAGGGGVWLLAAFGCGPGYGSPPLLAGVRQPRRWPFAWGWVGVSRGVCVCGAVRARVVSVLVCVSCVRGGVGVGVSSVCVGVCVCVWVWVCGWGRLGLVPGVGVGVVGVCRGWSLATPGGRS